MESATEVRYAGVTVGRAAHLRDRDGAGAFLVFPEPLPVGTPIVLKLEDGEQAARVTEVIESADPNVAGMRLRFVSTAEALAAPLVAAPRAPAEPAGAEPPSPSTLSAPAAEPEPEAPVEASAGSGSTSAPAAHAEGDSGSASAAQPEGDSGSASAAQPEGDSGASGGHGKRRRRRR